MADLSPVQLSALLGAGFLAGIVNTVSGGGSLLTLAALMFAGLPANAANATNRLGVMLASGTAAARFHKLGFLDTRQALKLVPITCLGALLGAKLSVDIDEQLFRRVIGLLMVVIVGIMWLKPNRWLKQEQPSLPAWAQQLVFAAIGVYGGFLQAGVGIFLLSALVLTAGQDLVRGNALKSALVFFFTMPALAVFLYEDLIFWVPGLVLAAGNTVGAVLGAHMTVNWGPAFVRAALTITVLVSAAGLLGLW